MIQNYKILQIKKIQQKKKSPSLEVIHYQIMPQVKKEQTQINQKMI